MSKDKKVYILVLNYNGWKDTLECVDSLLQIDYPDFHILVIDNASSDGSLEKLRPIESEKVKVLETNCNLGYAGGNNVGIRYAVEMGADIICVINNDTLVDSTFIKKCSEVLEDRRYAIVAPVILEFGTDTVQSAGGSISISKGRHEPYYRGTNYKDIKEKKDIIVSQFISGCCMVFRADLIKDIGYLPEAYFLFYEETEWCYKAGKKGYVNGCLPDCFIEHKDSGSVNSITGIKNYLLKRNRAAFVRRNGTVAEVIAFVFYITIFTIRLKIQKKTSLIGDIKCYADGLFKKVDKKYPYVVINEE